MRNNERTYMCVTILTPEFFHPFNSYLLGPDTLPWVRCRVRTQFALLLTEHLVWGRTRPAKSNDTIRPLQVVIKLSRKRRMSFENVRQRSGKFWFVFLKTRHFIWNSQDEKLIKALSQKGPELTQGLRGLCV